MSHDPTEFFLRLQESVDQSRQNAERAALRLRDRLDAMERITDQCARLLGQIEHMMETAATRAPQKIPTVSTLRRHIWQKAISVAFLLFVTGLTCGWIAR